MESVSASHQGMEALSELLSGVMVIGAHPDDETIGAGALLQRMTRPLVVIATDGAPRTPRFWGTCASREEYFQRRRSEAMQVLLLARVEDVRFLADVKPGVFVDQELYLRIEGALAVLTDMAHVFQPRALLSHAFEGGHPDHDASALLAYLLGLSLGIPVWEMPLYHRDPNGELKSQEFLEPEGEIIFSPTEIETQTKKTMLDTYVSQQRVIRELNFRAGAERFRRQPQYNFARPPHAGSLNYEVWGWPMKGTDVAAEFARVLASRPQQNTRAA